MTPVRLERAFHSRQHPAADSVVTEKFVTFAGEGPADGRGQLFAYVPTADSVLHRHQALTQMFNIAYVQLELGWLLPRQVRGSA